MHSAQAVSQGFCRLLNYPNKPRLGVTHVCTFSGVYWQTLCILGTGLSYITTSPHTPLPPWRAL